MTIDVDAEFAKLAEQEAKLAELQAKFERSLEQFAEISSALYPARRTWRVIDHQIAQWKVAESWYHIRAARALIPLGHRLQRDALRAAAVTMWREWLVALSAQVSEIWESVRAPWSLWTGLAPPLEPLGVTTIQRK
jgi:hypothetical protein